MHKSGFINIIGNPNVGKSTLINKLVGEQLSIITSKVQTTRHRILGIVNGDNFQLVFSDTPGIIKPAYSLQKSMMDFVKEAIEDADIILYVIEMGEKINIEKKLHQKFTDGTVPVMILINKIDLSTQNEVDLTIQTIQELYPKSEVFAISALKNFNIESVLNRLIDLVPLSPPYFPKDQFTDKPERFFVNEILRQKIFMYYDKEIPYSVEVQTEEFIEKPSIIKLRCYIIVERESQKGIIIGHRGIALKKIGSKARKDLEVFFKKKIFIEIKVKVSKNWRSSDIELKKFGYK
ncbi:MAG: GTPase Era [Bacteroidetes bacterium MED-G13]|nr:MAG: GTPase Era [Bacteroidetes bacterium MED-G13]|tara:strand:- start:246 stop:1121 length:876 start_codon:yes stop_codon:yes gene_type:complete